MSATAEIERIQEAVRGLEPGRRLLPVAGATKPALSEVEDGQVERLDVTRLSGITEYEPAELTLTALAGTPILEAQSALAEHGQHLPFDPPLAAAGATLGGVVAAGAAGSCSLRHGGIRDFVIGVRFVDGTGRLVSGGGKVVKNAAGFDLPKLMVGSIGRLGVMVQLSFKVFPRPPASTTLLWRPAGLNRAIEAAIALMRSPVELEALDITSEGLLVARLGGRADSLEARAARLASAIDLQAEQLRGDEEEALWRDAAELTWAPADNTLARVGLSIRRISALDAALRTAGARVRYTLAGTTAWIAWPAAAPVDDLDALLRAHGMPGVVLRGLPGVVMAAAGRSRLGPPTGGAFGTRIARALDPCNRFVGL